MTFGNWIREKRIQKKMKARECISRAKVTAPVWSRWENDSRNADKMPTQPEPETCIKVAIGLSEPIADVLRAAGYDPEILQSQLWKALMLKHSADLPSDTIVSGSDIQLSAADPALLAVLREISQRMFSMQEEINSLSQRQSVPAIAPPEHTQQSHPLLPPAPDEKSFPIRQNPNDFVIPSLIPGFMYNAWTGQLYGPDGEMTNADSKEAIQIIGQIWATFLSPKPNLTHRENLNAELRSKLNIPERRQEIIEVEEEKRLKKEN